MSGDFSRYTFDRTSHYSGVLMQQGRVQLDADWNEQLAIQLHRAQTEASDVIGPCGAPEDGGGFEVTASPRGADLLISPGRFYAEGILCELDATALPITFPAGTANQAVVPQLYVDGRLLAVGHWLEIQADHRSVSQFVRIINLKLETRTLTFDADISGWHSSVAPTVRRVLSYTTQPDYPDPEFSAASPLTSGPSGPGMSLVSGTYLAYLVVWERDVNALENPRIKEVALGGPDTAARLQTVAQVRLMSVTPPGSPPSGSPPTGSPPPGSPPGSPPSSPMECCVETPYPEWDRYIKPATGMMNARSVPPPPGDDPCLLPPTAGYQRLENQLYRVEIFQGGDTSDPASHPAFVWSRDNGTVESSILKVDGTDVYLSDLGKDDVLGFAADQWVEIVDRDDELRGARRFLAQIVRPPDTDLSRVTLSTSAAAFQNRSGLRLRRWDVAAGAITVTTGAWIDLESGVQVRFSPGSYKARSYWLIPARTATGELEWPPFEIPNNNPVPQPPLGPRYHFCRLALIEVVGSAWTVHDIRRTFPSLTCITADDICYQSNCADLADTHTVQEALDRLCLSNDLRFHKRNLHGWGIVCGLQVYCGPDEIGRPRRHVTVHKGYAIDTHGNDIIYNQDHQLDVIRMLTSASNEVAKDGDYCLILDHRAPGDFRIVPYAATPDTSLLSGTLLLDFYNDCIKSLMDFFNSQFVSKPEESNLPVGPAQKRIDTFTNVAIQFVNPDNGSYVYLSGDHRRPIAEHEDTILRNFYLELRKRLQSCTFCAMFDGARQFPAYPYINLNVATMFGKDFKTRLRVDPSGARAYAFGVDNAIHVYDLKLQRMDSVVQFPGASGTPVQDIAFSPDGSQVYAIATSSNQDTIFAVADVSGMQHTWRQDTTVICDVVLTTLATRASDATRVFAIGTGKGLYLIDPANVNPTPLPICAFAAFGHLVIDDTAGIAYATANSKGGTTIDSFDLLLAITVPGGQQIGRSFLRELRGNASDDIEVLAASQLGFSEVYVTAVRPSGGNKQLLSLRFANNELQIERIVDLGENTTVRLAFNPVTNFLMLTFEDSYRVKLYEPRKDALELSRHPVQIQPVGIVFSASANSAYVLNYLSNTITAMPAGYLTPANQPDLAALVNYRSGVIDAFLDLAGGFLQYLKDCFCDHLLTKCPSSEDQDLYLACLTIEKGQVKKICNFSKRKQVHTFPKVEYWLSLVPVIPLISKLFERLCCAALPSFFGEYNAPQPAPAVFNNPATGRYNVRFTGQTSRSAVGFVQTTDFRKALSDGASRLMTTGRFVSDSFQAPKPIPQASRPVEKTEVVGRSLDEVKARLSAGNVTVDRVLNYDPSKVAENALRFNTAPPKVEAGTSVTLVADQQGTVRYFIPATPEIVDLHSEVRDAQQLIAKSASAATEALTASQEAKVEAEEARKGIAETRRNVDQMTEAINQAGTTASGLTEQINRLQAQLADRDQQIAQLTRSTQDMQAQLSTVGDLRAQVDQLTALVRQARQ